MDGILNLDKPRSVTSFDVVALVRRLSGERRVGHAGTLDPEATGVLPVFLGQGTRLVEYLADEAKVYRAEITLGTATDTYDATGKITQSGDISSLTREQIEAAVSSFTGFIDQTPPMYSAVKHKGVPLYRLARAGVEVPRKARKVEISQLRIVDWRPPLLTLEVECSRGTYIRSLAHDLGQMLGCGAHLKSLVRLKSGPFHINDAISIPELEAAFRQNKWREFLQPIDVAVHHLPAVTVSEEDEKAILNGRPLSSAIEEGTTAKLRRAYSSDGRLIAILRYNDEAGCWKPAKVFRKRSKAA
ncbi:MAG: tRNA pseudouridine(55) synthase TruB [Chloroflexi bacterium]|nr:tRNA pseudouridine(55) synthase TruB [Chloroflexota bacterium]